MRDRIFLFPSRWDVSLYKTIFTYLKYSWIVLSQTHEEKKIETKEIKI